METPDGNDIGMISKQWSGFGREAFTDADNFGVNFPQDLDVKAKVKRSLKDIRMKQNQNR